MLSMPNNNTLSMFPVKKSPFLYLHFDTITSLQVQHPNTRGPLNIQLLIL